MPKTESLQKITEELKRKISKDKISVGEVIAAFDRRGFGPLLFIPSLFLVLPTGGIPGAPLVCGVIIICITAQVLMGMKHPWIPKRIKRITFNGKKLEKALEKINPVIKRFDRNTESRLNLLVTPAAKIFIAVICTILAIAIIPLGAIPYAMFLPALAIVFFSLGISVSDGLLVAIGLLLTIFFISALIYLVI